MVHVAAVFITFVEILQMSRMKKYIIIVFSLDTTVFCDP